MLRPSTPVQSQAETRAAAQEVAASRSTTPDAAVGRAPSMTNQAPAHTAPAQSTTPAAATRPSRPVQFDDDELDVPDFLK